MDFIKESKNLIWTSEGFGNSAAINLGKKIIVVDSMFNWNLAKIWKNEVEKHFSQKVEILFITHHHSDHCFGNQVFQEIPIISSQGVREMMEFNQREIWTEEELIEWKENGYGIDDLVIIHPNITFRSNIVIYGDDYLLEARCVDGHTLGSSFLWEPDNKILIAGDLVFNRQYPYGGDPSTDLGLWIKALEELISLKPELVISGHGPTAVLQDLIEIKDFLQATNKYIAQCVQEDQTPDLISERTDFPDYYSKEREERVAYSLHNWATKQQKLSK
ncbi:MAG: MBL fold metallo-hydrolase [Candidatus Kariarchaeaceae archaeon]|jgi:cyclase